MRSKVLIVFCVGALVLGSGGAASADPGRDSSNPLGVLDLLTQALIGVDDDLFALSEAPASSDPGTQHFGPYPSDTGDSGTCGPDWAADHVNRFFQIQVAGTNTYRVIEKFKDGTFQTFLGASPGACDSSDGTGPGVVNAGVTGDFHGYLVMTITSFVYTPENASCAPPCFFNFDFLSTVFGPAYVRTDDAYFFHYQSANQPLVYHEWKNASCNRGGNHGDIQSASVTGVATPTCP